MKICSKCKEEKAVESFSKNKAQRDGYSNYCKTCDNGRKDPVKQAELNKKYRANLTEAQKEKIREDNKAACKKYQKANNAKFCAKAAKRRAVEKRATPIWSNKEIVLDFYIRAEAWSKLTGESWHVDHIVPLNSDIVCGLHAHTNLTIIPGKENVSKGNRSWPDMP